MTDLVHLSSFSGSKGSKAKQVKLGPNMRTSTSARFAAIDYARNLVVAPDGSRITSTEKNVLLLLALAFNSDLGIAWPSLKTLAREACICERHCRRTIGSLEQKNVIRRDYMRREGLGGGQTSNEYFFPALGSPPQTSEAKIRRQEIQKIPRTPMAGRGGRRRLTATDTSVRPTRTFTTGEPGHECPPKESLNESLNDCWNDSVFKSLSESPVVDISAATVQQTKSQNTVSDSRKSVFAAVSLAQTAWKSSVQLAVLSRGAREIKKLRFRDVTVVSAHEDGAGVVHLTLRSPAPEKTEIGIAQHESTISQALHAFYGRTVKLKVIGHLPSSTLPAQSHKAEIHSANAHKGGMGG